MGIQKSREEFEKLPEIARKLISVNFNERLNKYQSKNPVLIECFETALYINGAWYAFQEQQKKIDEIKAMAENWINQEYTYNSYSTDIKIQQMKNCGRDI